MEGKRRVSMGEKKGSGVEWGGVEWRRKRREAVKKGINAENK